MRLLTGPRPGEVGEQAQLGLVRGLGQVTPLGQVAAVLGVAAAEQPVVAHGGAVVGQGHETGHLLSLPVLLATHRAVLGEDAVVQLGDLFGVVPGGPVHVHQRLGERTAFLLVQVFDLVHDVHDHVAHGAALADGLGRLVMPQEPAARVGHGAGLFRPLGRGQQKDLGLYGLGVNAGPAPVVRGLGVVDFAHYQPVQVVQGAADLVRVGHALGRVVGEHEAALDLLLVHAVEEEDVRVVLSPARPWGNPVVAEVGWPWWPRRRTRT